MDDSPPPPRNSGRASRHQRTRQNADLQRPTRRDRSHERTKESGKRGIRSRPSSPESDYEYSSEILSDSDESHEHKCSCSKHDRHRSLYERRDKRSEGSYRSRSPRDKRRRSRSPRDKRHRHRGLSHRHCRHRSFHKRVDARSKRRRSSSKSESDSERSSGELIGKSHKSSSRTNQQKTSESFQRYHDEINAKTKAWAEQRMPAITQGSFYERLDEAHAGALPTEDFSDVERRWEEDESRPFLVAQDKGGRGRREAFLPLYRAFLRYHGTPYERFIGRSSKYQLEFDSRENAVIQLKNGRNMHDPLESKGFSEGLKSLILSPAWVGNLGVLATCLQYVNILRTSDTRPWKLANHDPSSKFFEIWQEVVAESRAPHDAKELFEEVKDRIGSTQNFYCKLFDQIGKSVGAIRAVKREHVSKRKSDDDPYFIKTIDLTMLTNALDELSSWGLPVFLPLKLASDILAKSKGGRDYPPDKEFTTARDSAIKAYLVADEIAKRRSRTMPASPVLGFVPPSAASIPASPAPATRPPPPAGRPLNQNSIIILDSSESDSASPRPFIGRDQQAEYHLRSETTPEPPRERRHPQQFAPALLGDQQERGQPDRIPSASLAADRGQPRIVLEPADPIVPQGQPSRTPELSLPTGGST